MSEALNLAEYVTHYAIRGACTCGRCSDAPENPEDKQPTGHTADVVFFKVKANEGADKDTLVELLKAHEGHYGGAVDIFDGNEHNYMELGAWVGDQGIALMLMGLGEVLGIWKLLTPWSVLKIPSASPIAQNMAGMGMVAVKVQQ